jgi:tRNA-binding EMAP/Myf-like protein
MSVWKCEDCEAECEANDEKCPVCDSERPKQQEADADSSSPFKNIVVGKILECEDVSGGKAKKLSVDVGDSNKPLTIATTATNVAVGLHVVVAKVGAVINDETIKTATVYGVGSQGMLCDNASLGWKGGGSGAALVPPEQFPPGSTPPESRPRMS